ncbi:MAG: hypothetical protein QOH17_4294 [Pseudonocardiales bacterium]|jgi:hypothetical protein|nr:hypothetical protein [Pseudonocardiales bacterium]
MTSPVSTIDGPATQALQNALGAEHAAVWCYTLAVAFLAEPQVSDARRDADVHRELRARIEQTLTQIGQRPESAQPAYATPKPVTDAASAAALAVVAETDCSTAWRAVLEQTTDQSLRQAGLRALTDATLRCAGWRQIVGITPAIPPFPGRP